MRENLDLKVFFSLNELGVSISAIHGDIYMCKAKGFCMFAYYYLLKRNNQRKLCDNKYQFSPYFIN